MSLRNATDEEIESELARRRAPKPPRPVLNPHPDLTNLFAMCEAAHKSDGFLDEDFDHYVYESTMTALYGQTYWQWRNAQNR